jgi:SAM-dependent methyltransferase
MKEELGKPGRFLGREPQFCDVVGLDRREEDLRTCVLPDVEKATGGRVSLETLVQAKCTLDIGCGRGAYARALRNLGAQGVFIGAEDVSDYSGDNAWDEYKEIVYGDIRTKPILEKLAKYNFDCVVGIGLPPPVWEWVARNRVEFKVAEGGVLMIVTDSDVASAEYEGLSVFHGEAWIDESILVGFQPRY